MKSHAPMPGTPYSRGNRLAVGLHSLGKALGSVGAGPLLSQLLMFTGLLVDQLCYYSQELGGCA